MDLKEQIKSRVSITDVVGLYVNLKPAGKNLKALCPFHTEKTPSFYVMPDKDSFACYGCNKFGDLFTFIEEIEHINFHDAMNFLIDKFNIPVDRKQMQKTGNKDYYVKINEIALNYFKSNLFDSPEGKNAQEYLRKRGITKKTIDLFELGYSDNKWDGLHNHLIKKSCDIEKAVELGLLIKNDSKKIYDRFRGRIIFPILSESGTPIAFGGRTIFDEPNKYLNSPDTPLYKKSKHLYAFYHSKKAIRDKKSAILVEGYFDAVSLFQNGVENVVASLGTALTENQIYLLKRFSDQIYIFYDSDKAGVEAAIRGIEKMFEQNINPGILSVGQHNVKDPDDFIRAHGLKAFNELIEQAGDGFKFLLRHISKKFDLNIPERKNEAVQEVMTFVEKINEVIIRDEYVRMTADFFKVDENTLKMKNKKSARTLPMSSAGKVKRLNITVAERHFLEAIILLPELLDELKPLLTKEILSVLISGNIIRAMLEHYNKTKSIANALGKISETLSDAERVEIMELFEKTKSMNVDRYVLEKQIEDSFMEFHEMVNKRETRRLDQEIKMAERANNFDLVIRLIKEKSDFIQSKYKQNSLRGGTVDQH